MTEKTQETIIAKFVKSSGVTIFLEGQETGIPCELKILSIIKKGDKVQAGNEYRWLVNIDAKGNRAIVNVGPADEDTKFKTGKEILQENIEKKRADDVEAQINLAKQAEQIAAKNKEDEEYARNLAAEKAEKDKKKAVPTQKVPVTVVPAKVVEEVPQNQSVAVFEPSRTVVKTYSNEDLLLIRNVAARNCSEPEFKLLMYLSKTYGLDPLLKQIWAVKRNDNQPALIFAGRDGFLAVAHRSGHFDGMQSGVNYEIDKDGKKVIESAWCKVWRNDMTHPFETQVPFNEFNTGFGVWKSHPSAMILKVAESVCLRKAFSIDGIYAPEEINTEG
jgi:phage recombination protein Bet